MANERPSLQPANPAVADARAGAPSNAAPTALSVRDLSVAFGPNPVLRRVTVEIPRHAVTAIIGPSGCGKSTFLRTLNRLHELIPAARIQGRVLLFGEDIYASSVEPAMVRRRIGMVFQKSNPFPTLSIAENVTVGLRLNGVRDRGVLAERTEQALSMAALWNEVKDRLKEGGMSLDSRPHARAWAERLMATPGFALPYDLIPKKDAEFPARAIVSTEAQ